MTRKSLILSTSALGLLSLVVNCGGGGGGSTPTPTPTPTFASKLAYTNPPATGYRLEVDPATNNTGNLKLNLVGPSGEASKGIAFYLTATGTMVDFTSAMGGSQNYLKEGTVLTLGSTPQLFKVKYDSAKNELSAGLFQKSGFAQLATAPIATVGLTLKSNVTAGPVSLGVGGKKTVIVDGTGTPKEITLGVGTVQAVN